MVIWLVFGVLFIPLAPVFAVVGLVLAVVAIVWIIHNGKFVDRVQGRRKLHKYIWPRRRY